MNRDDFRREEGRLIKFDGEVERWGLKVIALGESCWDTNQQKKAAPKTRAASKHHLFPQKTKLHGQSHDRFLGMQAILSFIIYNRVRTIHHFIGNFHIAVSG